MDSEIPSRNPRSYCRLCLSQVNLLTVLGSSDDANQPPMKAVLQKLHHYTKVALLAEDFPCAICGVCKSQLDEFHEFRRNVVRNHNAVKIFRQTFGDEEECVEQEEEEEEKTYVEIIEDSLADIIKEEYGDTAELKEADVYHVNGELRTVVVKPDSDAPAPPQLQVQVSPKKTPPAAPVNILNKSGGHAASLPTAQNYRKRIFNLTPAETVYTVFKCSTCLAVFHSQDNLSIHKRTDHPEVPTTLPNSSAKRLVVKKVEPRKPPASSPPKRPLPKPSVSPQTQKLLFKCVSCSSSFVQEENLKHHQLICKPAALSKLDLSQITIKRTKVQENPPASRIQCDHCTLTYKSRDMLNKHLIEVHQVAPLQQQQPSHFCTLCSLNYSCLEDLQLHNRALHAYRCKICAKDSRRCMHKPAAGGSGSGEREGVKNGNKATNVATYNIHHATTTMKGCRYMRNGPELEWSSTPC
uniref:Uncharacterized protein n=1 Tax=Culex tarsalis TaxID=7177 RepID=A0A1Q3F642_CULTA